MKRWIAPRVLVDNYAQSKHLGEKPTRTTIWQAAKNIPFDFYPEQGTSVGPITNKDQFEWAVSKLVFWGGTGRRSLREKPDWLAPSVE